MRRIVPLLVAGALVLGACGDDEASESPSSSSIATTTTAAPTTTTVPSTTSSTVATTTTTAAPATTIAVHPLLPEAFGRELIPWEDVAPGWSIALFGTASGYPDVESPGAELVVAYLAAPDGTLFEIASWPTAEGPEAIDDVRPDGRVAILEFPDGPQLLDLSTGEAEDLPGDVNGSFVTFTRPAGDGFVVLTEAGTVELHASGGSETVDLGDTETWHTDYGRRLPPWLLGPDGSIVVNRPGGPVVFDVVGRLLRAIDEVEAPCTAARWLRSGTIVLRCETADEYPIQQLWLVDPAGVDDPIELTPADVADLEPLFDGFVDTLWAGDTVYLQGETAAGGGWYPIYLWNRSGAPEPFGDAVAGQLITGDRNSLTVLLAGCCGEVYGGLTHYTPDGKVITVLDAPEGIVGVVDAHGIEGP